MGMPSISRALNGNANKQEKKEHVKEKVQPEVQPKADKPFSHEDIKNIWPQFISKFKDQIHLYKTLEATPQLKDNEVIIEVENSVQQEKIRSLKPEIIGHLSRNLQNSNIDVKVILNKKINENKALTDEQKLKMMIQKNPALMLFKNKFNLDFN